MKNTIWTVSGGAIGSVSSAGFDTFDGTMLSMTFPSIEALINTIILAFVGATIGYFAKLLYDYLIKKFYKKGSLDEKDKE